MPSYAEIMSTDLSALTTAAEGWKSMAGQFKTMEDVYKDEVQSVSAGNGWLGSSANTAATNSSMTRSEFASAQKEALAMESLLRDAHARFTDLKGRVKSAVADAETAGMKVSDAGIASYDFSKADPASAKAIRHDPDLPEVERSWTRRIGDAVKAVTEFDADVKTALLNASGADGTAMFGFNAKPVGDVEAVEALALTHRIRDGKASPEELDHYNDLLKQNSGDEHFGQAYLNALGAKDTLLLADQMHLASNERGASAADKKLYESISTGLAGTIASGTRDPDGYAYKPFVSGLKEHGGELVADGLRPTYGYQALVTLMGHGDGYGKQFLNDLGDGMIEAEKSKPHMYDHAYDSQRPDLVSDPLDGLLGIMAEDPDAATYFLDPEAPGNKNEHLKYMLTDRDMPDPWISTGVGQPIEMHGDKTPGLGAALQAAATGHTDGEKLGPPGPHTEGQARVMHHAIRYLDDEMGGDEFPKDLEGLRQPMAKALVDYVGDTHLILGGQESDLGGVGGSPSIHGSGDQAHLAVGQGSLVRVMRGIADDGPSFALLYEAERAYSADQLATAAPYKGDSMHGVSADWDNRAHDIGAATGALNGIGGDVYKDKGDDQVKWAESTSEHTAAVANGLIGEIPVVGTVGGSLIDSVKYEWVEGVKDEAEEQGKKDSSGNYGKGMDGTNKLFDAWGAERQVQSDPAFVHAKDTAGTAYTTGRDAARAHLG
ncbi:hypothetical protein GCM10010371_59300 [Streptomyces subrutilus]|uniref:Uncharacterized protein n=1 Tax=Streptomyces subrutilus TaxID=36818 RepID=A0A5P2USC8_9ACTN|nr:DUF6571 family protein [Streptomyces subrutilus]QEU80511.1 hypothetical protein CP968_21435 [Streptomyces subrutilus]GGZ91595.1 hypothetical protein GCM10010371_59300 [Streptomyces subrutilus]